jgi:hypothetical protein
MAQQVADADDDADDDDDAEGDDTGAAGADSELSELSSAQHVVTIPDFAPALCRQLRGVFDARFDDPRATSEERFLWDYFYVRNQYTMHRTQVWLLWACCRPIGRHRVAHARPGTNDLRQLLLLLLLLLLLGQAGAYFPEALHEQLVDALLEYGEKQLVSEEQRAPPHLTRLAARQHQQQPLLVCGRNSGPPVCLRPTCLCMACRAAGPYPPSG